MGMIDRMTRWLTRASNTDPGWYALLETMVAETDTTTEASALQLTAVQACVRILSNSVAMLPLHVYRRGDAGEKARADDHPVADLLRWPETMTGYEMRRLMMAHVLLWGNAYLYIDSSRQGRPEKLTPLMPWNMRVEWRGQPIYTYLVDGQRAETIPAVRLVHLRGMTLDGYQGLSVVGGMMREVLGVNASMQRYSRAFWANGARPGGILSHPGRMTDEAHRRLTERWAATHGGAGNAARTAILEEGMTYQAVGMPNDEAQFLESRQYGVIEIARAFGVPPHLLGDLTRSSYASVEQLGIEFVQYGLQPWLTLIEQALGASLFTVDERRTYYVEHVIDGLLRGDSKTRYEAYSIGVQNGWLSRNEVRQLENMNPAEGLDDYLAPLNMTTAEQIGREPDAAPAAAGPAPTPPARALRALLPPIVVDDDGDDHEHRADEDAADDDDGLEEAERAARKDRQALASAYVGLWEDAARRLVRRETADLRRALAKLDAEYVTEFYRALRPQAPTYFRPVLQSAARATLQSVQREMGRTARAEDVADYVTAYLESLAAAWCDNSQGQLLALLREGYAADADGQQLVSERLDEWEIKRPTKVGKQQGYESVNALAVAIYATIGVGSVVWAARGKSCPWCRSMSGRVVQTGQAFLSGEDLVVDGQAMTVWGKRAHAPLHGGCDCTVVARR